MSNHKHSRPNILAQATDVSSSRCIGTNEERLMQVNVELYVNPQVCLWKVSDLHDLAESSNLDMWFSQT